MREISSSEDGEKGAPTIRTFEERFFLAKDRASQATTAKERLMFTYDAIAEGLSLLRDEALTNAVRGELDKLDWKEEMARNWVDKGHAFSDWEELASMRVFNDAAVILAKVQAKLMERGILIDVEETVEDLEDDYEVLLMRKKIGEMEKELDG